MIVTVVGDLVLLRPRERGESVRPEVDPEEVPRDEDVADLWVESYGEWGTSEPADGLLLDRIHPGPRLRR